MMDPMSETIEPTAIIGPDGAVRTGWELPTQFGFVAPDLGFQAFRTYHRYGASAIPHTILGSCV
jgi:hypothetical protein